MSVVCVILRFSGFGCDILLDKLRCMKSSLHKYTRLHMKHIDFIAILKSSVREIIITFLFECYNLNDAISVVYPRKFCFMPVSLALLLRAPSLILKKCLKLKNKLFGH